MPPFYLRWSPDSVVLGGYITLYDQGKYEGCEEVQNFIIYYFRNCLLIKLNPKLSLQALYHILQTSIGTSNTLFLYAFLSSKIGSASCSSIMMCIVCMPPWACGSYQMHLSNNTLDETECIVVFISGNLLGVA